MEIEMRHHYTPTRIAKSGTLTTENADEVCSNRNSFFVSENTKRYSHSERQFLKK